MTKRKKIIIILLLFILLYNAAVFLIFPPVKYTVTENQLKNETRNYIICNYVETTDFFWYTEDGKYVMLVSDISDKEFTDMFDYDFLSGERFVFYGADIGKTDDSYRIFRVDDWSVIGPILPRLYYVHGIPMIAPPFYLTERDIKQNQRR
ncbi:MAG: hypothetical protein IJ062_07335 [Firmicutes bacterium]|nr:hypothetical protein [Bacillota bacterium]